MKDRGSIVGLKYHARFIKKRFLPAASFLCYSLLLTPNIYGWNYSAHSTSSLNHARRLGIIAAHFDNWPYGSSPQISTATQDRQSTCSDGWYITGYYVPREDELPDTAEEIYVERQGNLSFSQKFLSETRTEGWGITRFGWALGYHSGGWHRSDAGALDAAGNLLTVGAIAIDRSVIPRGAKVLISTLPSPWASKTFQATDVGVGIVGQHIDVFTGVGSSAEQETFRITSENNRVCFTSSNTH